MPQAGNHPMMQGQAQHYQAMQAQKMGNAMQGQVIGTNGQLKSGSPDEMGMNDDGKQKSGVFGGRNQQQMMQAADNMMRQFGQPSQPQVNQAANDMYYPGKGPALEQMVHNASQFQNMGQNGGNLDAGNQGPSLQKKSKRIGNLPGKIVQAPPEGFYCYYPELFDKPNTQIFNITKYPSNRIQK